MTTYAQAVDMWTAERITMETVEEYTAIKAKQKAEINEAAREHVKKTHEALGIEVDE